MEGSAPARRAASELARWWIEREGSAVRGSEVDVSANRGVRSVVVLVKAPIVVGRRPGGGGGGGWGWPISDDALE